MGNKHELSLSTQALAPQKFHKKVDAGRGLVFECCGSVLTEIHLPEWSGRMTRSEAIEYLRRLRDFTIESLGEFSVTVIDDEKAV